MTQFQKFPMLGVPFLIKKTTRVSHSQYQEEEGVHSLEGEGRIQDVP